LLLAAMVVAVIVLALVRLARGCRQGTAAKARHLGLERSHLLLTLFVAAQQVLHRLLHELQPLAVGLRGRRPGGTGQQKRGQSATNNTPHLFPPPLGAMML